MALNHADRVQETSVTTGTGTYNLDGAVTGFRTFVAGISTGNTCFYAATDGTGWEVGIGTVTSGSPDTLARTTILASSNGGAAVNWGAGTKYLINTIPAGRFIHSAGEGTLTGGWRVTPYNGGTVSSGTYTPEANNGNVQYYTNNGAHTLAVPANDCEIDILITNGAAAGTITISGSYQVGSGGDSFTTTNGDDFIFQIKRINAISTYKIVALQ